MPTVTINLSDAQWARVIAAKRRFGGTDLAFEVADLAKWLQRCLYPQLLDSESSNQQQLVDENARAALKREGWL